MTTNRVPPSYASGQSSSSGFNRNFEFIYDIPRTERKRLSCFLDQDGKWVGLALRRMGYCAEDIEGISRCCSRSGESPSEQLLTKWGNLNHTITELFVVLASEHYVEALDIIRTFVDPKYHVLIKKENNATDSHKILNDPNAGPSFALEYTTDRNAESAQHKAAPILQEQPGPVVNPPAVPQLENIAAIAGGLPQFSFEELRLATDNWNSANELGKGGFGIVYKGYFKHTFVAIKKIKGINTESARTELRQSFNELKYLNSCRHENVVPLFGCSMELRSSEPCLVYQYMPGGSLDTRLFLKAHSKILPLSMVDRVKIAKGTARGLQYLHTFSQKPIIHGDIKPGNILLDNANDPKIGDFGLTRELSVTDSSMKVSRVYGTRPYIPREFITHRQLSTKVDSFSYGLVLYEMITGQRVWDEKRPNKHLKDVVINAARSKLDIRSLMDSTLSTEDSHSVNSCVVLLQAGFMCTDDNPEKRQEMVAVYRYLMELLRE